MSGPSLKTRPLFKLPLKNPFFCYSDHHSVRGPFNYRELFKHLNTETVWYSDPRCLSIATLDWEFSFGFFLPVSCPQVQPGSAPSGSRGSASLHQLCVRPGQGEHEEFRHELKIKKTNIFLRIMRQCDWIPPLNIIYITLLFVCWLVDS